MFSRRNSGNDDRLTDQRCARTTPVILLSPNLSTKVFDAFRKCFKAPFVLNLETLHGQDLITRLAELKAQGKLVLRMKCESLNGVYEIEWVEDWEKSTKVESSKSPLGNADGVVVCPTVTAQHDFDFLKPMLDSHAGAVPSKA